MSIREILLKLNERFVVGFEGRNGYNEIFVNPDRKEIREVASRGESFRFIGDKEIKSLYVADVNVLHEEMQEEIGNMKQHYFDLFSGVAINEGRYVRIYYDNLNCNIDDEILEGEYDWVERYNFNIFELKKEMLEDKNIPMEEWEFVLGDDWKGKL